MNKEVRTTVADAWSYVAAVAHGDIVASKYLIKACKKLHHEYHTLQHQDDYPWFFYEPAAQHVLDFLTLCEYPDGIVSGQFVHLHPWQNFVITMSYGWRNKANHAVPRFNDIYTRVARKNDKTTGISGLMAYELLTGPDGHEQYITAVDKNQAGIAFKKAVRIAEKLPYGLKKSYGTLTSQTGSSLVARSRENKASDGASAYRAWFDEAARIEDDESFNIIRSSQGAWQGRHQNWYISTAQANRSTAYYREMETGRSMLDGALEVPPELDRKLYLFYEIDEEDDWEDETVWSKANPSMGLSVRAEDLAQEAFDAKVSPANKSEFLRKKMNRYTASETPWLNVDSWNALKVDKLERVGACYVGLDMGKTSDLNAVSIIWVNEKGYYEADFKAFLPREAFDTAPKHVVSTYNLAVEDGILQLTPGRVIDEEAIYAYVHELCSTYDVKEVAYDPYKSQGMMTRLEEDGLPMVFQRQGRISLGPAVAETEKEILAGNIRHLGHAFIAWQINNCQVEVDLHDLQNLQKPTDRAMKIDNVVAAVMALGRASVHGGLSASKPGFHVL